jgi:isopentenyl-diphosphate delta-isomerase
MGPGSIVSFDSDELILVDEEDKIIGYRNKADCHEGPGILHRAFSILLFDYDRRLLIQQRSGSKRLWPLAWSNSCCSHPRRGETLGSAAERRLGEELGVATRLFLLYKFRYRARYLDLGSENELCSVFIGSVNPTMICPNNNEVETWRFVTPGEMDREIASSPEQFTPWAKAEWHRIREEFWPHVESL